MKSLDLLEVATSFPFVANSPRCSFVKYKVRLARKVHIVHRYLQALSSLHYHEFLCDESNFFECYRSLTFFG